MKKTLQILMLSFVFSACVTQQKPKEKVFYYRQPGKLMWPLDGKITSYYGKRNGSFHHGIDIKGPKDRNIYNVAPGVVEFSGYQRGYGWTVIVKHKNYKTLYGHCYELKVKKGQRIRKGQTIASVGTSGRSSGYHLHFEYRDLAGKSFDPLIFLTRR